MAGQQALTSGLQFLQPEAIQQFQNPFQQQVIDRTMAELDRQADIRRAGADAAAVRSGAFGGSRQGVQRAEAERGLQQVKGDTLSRLLSQGFSSALQAAQNAGRLSGGLGQAFGTLAGTTGDIGRLQQALGQADISQLTQLGALRQGAITSGTRCTKTKFITISTRTIYKVATRTELITRYAKCFNTFDISTGYITWCKSILARYWCLYNIVTDCTFWWWQIYIG